MSEQLLNLASWCIIWMVNTFIKYLLIIWSNFDERTHFCTREPRPVLGNPYSFMYSKVGPILLTHTVKVKELWNISEKDWLKLTNC